MLVGAPLLLFMSGMAVLGLVCAMRKKKMRSALISASLRVVFSKSLVPTRIAVCVQSFKVCPGLVHCATCATSRISAVLYRSFPIMIEASLRAFRPSSGVSGEKFVNGVVATLMSSGSMTLFRDCVFQFGSVLIGASLSNMNSPSLSGGGSSSSGGGLSGRSISMVCLLFFSFLASVLLVISFC